MRLRRPEKNKKKLKEIEIPLWVAPLSMWSVLMVFLEFLLWLEFHYWHISGFLGINMGIFFIAWLIVSIYVTSCAVDEHKVQKRGYR